MKYFRCGIFSAAFLMVFMSSSTLSAQALLPEESAGEHFNELLFADSSSEARYSIDSISSNWSDSYIPLVIETMNYSRSTSVRAELLDILEDRTGQSFGADVQAWYSWIWNRDVVPEPSYANFKADLYRNIDSRFETYFRDRQDSARIRLDEIRWGGVVQDGIPPLRNPEMLTIEQAAYLEDDNIVFGIEINGDARAYPKRILAWHEMFTDTIGGVPIAGVYCTLCGTVIPYKTQTEDASYTLGTSGFLYRSNKLMYDQATQSLWSTTRGEPVLGPLVDQGIALEYESVVTTTWGEWKKRHPDTTVLSLDTGHRRDYGEGVAYNDYFSTDRLMFHTPFQDDRLDNKREVLALRFFAAPNQQLAIDTEFLKDNPIFNEQIGSQKFVVLTDDSGANRVYDPQDHNFVEYDGYNRAVDDQGIAWQVEEEWMQSENGDRLERLPYHRAFWFGWRAAYPETRLIN